MNKNNSNSKNRELAYNGIGSGGGGGGSKLSIKHLSYVGTGGRDHVIDFGEPIKAIVGIRGMGSDNHPVLMTYPHWAFDTLINYNNVTWWGSDYSGVGGQIGNEGQFNDDFTQYHIIRGTDDGAAFNLIDTQYDVYYLV